MVLSCSLWEYDDPSNPLEQKTPETYLSLIATDTIFAYQDTVTGELHYDLGNTPDTTQLLDTLKNAILDILKKSVKTEKIPVRQGEKFHESLINSEELRNTFEVDNLYVILDKQMHSATFSKWNDLKETSLKEQYSSDNVEILTKEKLVEIIIKEGFLTTNE